MKCQLENVDQYQGKDKLSPDIHFEPISAREDVIKDVRNKY
jgi:hypothetical protein